VPEGFLEFRPYPPPTAESFLASVSLSLSAAKNKIWKFAQERLPHITEQSVWIIGAKGRESVSNLWKVFLDDSGDEKKLKFIIVGAVFGNASAWNEFNKVWRKTLHRAPRIEHFHYKEFIRLKGQFLQFRDPVKWPGKAGSMAANEKRAALEDVIAKSDLTSYGVALNVSDYQQARRSNDQTIASSILNRRCLRRLATSSRQRSASSSL